MTRYHAVHEGMFGEHGWEFTWPKKTAAAMVAANRSPSARVVEYDPENPKLGDVVKHYDEKMQCETEARKQPQD